MTDQSEVLKKVNKIENRLGRIMTVMLTVSFMLGIMAPLGGYVLYSKLDSIADDSKLLVKLEIEVEYLQLAHIEHSQEVH